MRQAARWLSPKGVRPTQAAGRQHNSGSGSSIHSQRGESRLRDRDPVVLDLDDTTQRRRVSMASDRSGAYRSAGGGRDSPTRSSDHWDDAEAVDVPYGIGGHAETVSLPWPLLGLVCLLLLMAGHYIYALAPDFTDSSPTTGMHELQTHNKEPAQDGGKSLLDTRSSPSGLDRAVGGPQRSRAVERLKEHELDANSRSRHHTQVEWRDQAAALGASLKDAATGLPALVWFAPFLSGGGYCSEAISFVCVLHLYARVKIVQLGVRVSM